VVSALCPSAEAALLSQTYQPWKGLTTPPPPEIQAQIGRVETRWALSLSDPEQLFREVDVGGEQTRTVWQSMYHATAGRAHAAGRSCDNLVATDRKDCPAALEPEANESHVCTRDNTFCIVIPRDWCAAIGGQIGGNKNDCIRADRQAQTLAEILHVIRDHSSGGSTVQSERQGREILGSVAFTMRDLLLRTARTEDEATSTYCRETTDPPGHLAVLNGMRFRPAVYGMSFQALEAQRPDLRRNAEMLCLVKQICLGIAFRDNEDRLLEISRNGLSSQLCRTRPDSVLAKVELDMIDLFSAAKHHQDSAYDPPVVTNA
jgi:hypothetical protein